MFIEENQKFGSLQKVHAAIKSLEQISIKRTHIFKIVPETNYGRYKCALHVECTFTFYFGADSNKDNNKYHAFPKSYCKK